MPDWDHGRKYDDIDLFAFNRIEKEGPTTTELTPENYPGKALELLRDTYNIVFITVDSLSFEVYRKARELGYTGGIDSFGKVFPAIAPASFTLPSHAALFGGHLPQVLSNNTSLGLSRKNRLFNSATSNAEERQVTAGFLLEGKDIFEGFRKRGYAIRAFCGAIFFEKRETDLGPLAHYFKEDEMTYFGHSVSMDRTSKDVPIGNLELITNSIDSLGKIPWFLFVNDTSTHIPYLFNDEDQSSVEAVALKASLKRNKSLFQGRVDPEATYETIGKKFERAQIEALRFFDSRLVRLIQGLKRQTQNKILLIVCGDHGECFGRATFMGETREGYFGHCWNGAEENIVVPLLMNIIESEVDSP